MDSSSLSKRLSWSQQQQQQPGLRMLEAEPSSCDASANGRGGGVVVVSSAEATDRSVPGGASASVSTAGPHSLSLSISTEFEPGWENGKEARYGGLIKIVGGKSAPPSPLTAGRLLGFGGSGGGRQCATPPVPPRNHHHHHHHHHHVSTTYISQDRHTLIVTTPESERIAVTDSGAAVNGGGSGSGRTLWRANKTDTNVPTKPEIKINLAEPRETATAVAATVMVVPPVSISISGHQAAAPDKLRLREVRLTESS